MTRMAHRVVLVACVVWAPWQASSPAQQPTFRARVDLVRLQVLVTDDRRPVPGLAAPDFGVRNNGVQQDIEAVFSEPRPLDTLLVMDRSESMAGEPLARLKAAALETMNALGPEDRCGLLTFSHRIALDAELASDRDSMRRAIEGIRAEGLTSIIDALYGALSVRFAPERRSLILLFSDGFDNRSWATAGEVTTRAQQSETIIDAVAYRWTSSLRGPGSRTTEPDVSFLRSLAADTGGEVIVSSRPDDFSGAFSSLLERARSRYLVTYYPKGVDRAGWHDVKVTLRNHRGNVTVRRGYAVPSGEGRD